MDNSCSSDSNDSYAKNEINREKIRRDLNSPSASVRLRALRSLTDPTKSAYNFDVPHQMQNIISDEERRSPYVPKTFAELMKDIIVYVEIRSNGKNISESCRKVISSYGVKVNKRFNKNTTHVVFVLGRRSTYEKAKKMGIPLVSLLWIEKCKEQMRLLNPELFKITDLEKYENPELYHREKKLPKLWDGVKLKRSEKIDKNNKNDNLNSTLSISKQLDNSQGSTSSSDYDDSFVNLTPKLNKTTSLAKAVLLKNSSQKIRRLHNKKTESTILSVSENKSIQEIESNKRDTMEYSLRRRKTICNPTDMEVTTLNSILKDMTTEFQRKSLTNRSLDFSELSTSSLDSFMSNKKRKKSSTDVEQMEETLMNNQNRTGLETETKKRKYTSYGRKSLDMSSREGNNTSFLNNDDENDENIRPTPTSTRKCTIVPKNLSFVFTATTTTTTATETVPEPTVKKRKLFVHDTLLPTPSPPPPSPSTPSMSPSPTTLSPISQNQKYVKSTSKTTQIKNKNEKKNQEINLPKRFLITRKSQAVSTTPINSRTLITSKNENCRRSLMDFNLSKSLKLPLTQSQQQSQQQQNKPCKSIVLTSIGKKEQIDFVKQTIKKLGGFIIEDVVTKRTTHVICFQIRRTMNILRGMIRGLWILNYNWVEDSFNSGKWLYEELYEIQNFSRTIEISRSRREAFGKNYRMDLFDDLQPFYVSEKSTISSKDIIELITLCYGKISESKTDAKYIIGEYYNENDKDDDEKSETNSSNGNCNNSKIIQKICLEPEWIIDSIMSNRLKKIQKYLIKPD